MKTWRDLSFQGYSAIEKIAAVFVVGPPLPPPIPFVSLRVTVHERKDGSFAAHLDVGVRDAQGRADAEVGHGATADEALENALERFWRLVQQHGATKIEDFVFFDSEEWRRAE